MNEPQLIEQIRAHFHELDRIATAARDLASKHSRWNQPAAALDLRHIAALIATAEVELTNQLLTYIDCNTPPFVAD